MFAFDAVDQHFSPPSASAASLCRRSSRTDLVRPADEPGHVTSGESEVVSGIGKGDEGGGHSDAMQEVHGDGVRGSETGTMMDGDGSAATVLNEGALSPTLCSTITAPTISITPRLSTVTTEETPGAQQNGKPVPPGVAANAPLLTGRAARKKKRGMKKGAPAMSTVRGFITPAASGDEDSDCSTASSSKRLGPRFGDLGSSTSSPGIRPSSAGGGISALRLQLDTLNLSPGSDRLSSMARSKSKLGSQTPSSASMTSETMSDGDANEMTSYEIPLEHDFVSPDVGQKPIYGVVEGGLIRDQVPAPRKMAASDFQPISCLGKGTYGTVLLVKQTATGRLYAQKQFRKASLTVHKKLVEQTKTERTILESVNRHPFVVKLYYAFQDHEKLYLILEYAPGGELFTHLAAERMFPESVASFYLAEMVLALDHLHHTVGVVYRDLKPENCLLDAEGHLLLTDFGLSKVALSSSADRCSSILGTIEYMAPEVILGRPYGHAVDWWSLGALAHDLLTGAPPFTANNHAKIQDKITRQKLALPYFLGPDAKDLLTRLLRKEPAKRLGASMPRDMATIRKHRFFRKIDWLALERREVEPPIRPLVTDPELAENFAAEFTELALSPVVGAAPARTWTSGLGTAGRGAAMGTVSWAAATAGAGVEAGDGDGGGVGTGISETDPFGGFSFVASRSLLECGDGFF